MALVLYHYPPSYASQKVRLALAEKGAPYTSRLVATPQRETYEAWYARMNPGMTVPTLVHDDRVIPDSHAILRHVAAHVDGPALMPEEGDAAAEVERWLAMERRFPMRALSYAFPPLSREGLFGQTIAKRRAALRRLEQQDPSLKRAVMAKHVDLEVWQQELHPGAQGRAELLAGLDHLLDALDAALQTRPFVAGDAYSLADVVFTALLARLQLMRMGARIARRPALAAWYARMRQRPSFEAADVWTSMRVAPLVRHVLPGLLANLAWAAVGTLLAVGLWRWARGRGR